MILYAMSQTPFDHKKREEIVPIDRIVAILRKTHTHPFDNKKRKQRQPLSSTDGRLSVYGTPKPTYVSTSKK